MHDGYGSGTITDAYIPTKIQSCPIGSYMELYKVSSFKLKKLNGIKEREEHELNTNRNN